MNREKLSPIAGRIARVGELERIKTKRQALVEVLESDPKIQLRPRKNRPQKTPEQVESQIGRVIDFVLEKDVLHTTEKSRIEVELVNYRRAMRYQNELTSLQSDVNSATQGLAEGRVKPSEFADATNKYSTFVTRRLEDEGIKEGIALLNQEEEWKKRHEGEIEAAVTSGTIFEEKPKKQPKVRKEKERHLFTDTTDGFETPDGKIIGGKIGDLLQLLRDLTIEDTPATRGVLLESLYPGVELAKAKKAFGVLILNARDKLKKHGYNIESIRQKGPKSSTREHIYKIVKLEDATESKPEVVKSKRSEVVADAADRIIKTLIPSWTNIYTYSDLKELIGVNDPEEFSAVMDKVRARLKQEGMRLAYVSNRENEGNDGVYVEKVRRKPLPRIEVLGEIIKINGKEVKLTEDQVRLFWLFSRKGNTAVYDDELARIYSERGNKTKPEDIVKTIAEINTKLSRYLGINVEGLLVYGGNSQLGFWHKVYDAKVNFINGFHPVHRTRLNALNVLFDNQGEPDTNAIIEALGPTKEGKTRSHPHTAPQAEKAIQRALVRLENRFKKGMLTDEERKVYDQITLYKATHGINNRRDMFTWIKQALGSKSSVSPGEALKAVKNVPDLSLAQDQHQLDEEAEFILWNENDVAIIATFMMHETRLANIFQKSDIQPLHEYKLQALSQMGVDDPKLTPGSNGDENRKELLRQRRSEALDKVKKMMEDPEFKEKMDLLHEKNISVWELIMKITELDGVTVEYGDRANDIRLRDISGIEILRALCTDSKNSEIGEVRHEKREHPDIEAFSRVISNLASKRTVLPKPKPKRTPKVVQAEPSRIENKAKKEKKNGVSSLEKRDPQVKKRILEIFTLVSENPNFSNPIGGKKVLEEFPEITTESLDEFMHRLEVRYNKERKPMKPRLGVREITYLYYKDKFGKNLTSQQQRKLEQLVYDMYPIWMDTKDAKREKDSI